MFLELKDAPMIHPNAFKDTITVQQTVIKDGYLCVLFAIVISVNVDLHPCCGVNPKKDTNDKQFFGYAQGRSLKIRPARSLWVAVFLSEGKKLPQ